MEANGNCIIAIGATQEALKQANSIFNTMYEGSVSHPLVVQPFLIPHVRHVCTLLLLVMPYIRQAHLCLHIGISLKGRITHI